ARCSSIAAGRWLTSERLTPDRLVRRSGPALGLRLREADNRGEKLAQTARRESAERADRDFRGGGGAAEPEIGREQALRAAECRADHRNLAGQRIHRVSRGDGAVQLHPVAPGI